MNTTLGHKSGRGPNTYSSLVHPIAATLGHNKEGSFRTDDQACKVSVLPNIEYVQLLLSSILRTIVSSANVTE